MSNSTPIWSDRKRIFCGLPWTFTTYTLTSDRLFIETGVLGKHEDEVRLYRILDISLSRSFSQRIFGLGTIHCCSADKTMGDFVKNVEKMYPDSLFVITGDHSERFDFAIEQDMMLVYLDTIKGNGFQTITTKRIGHVAPLHAAGIGKLLLLNYSESQLMKLIHSKGLPRFTDNTLCTYESLKMELEKISKQGYAMDDQECEEGIRCIAVPIKDYSGTIIGGISISGSTDQILPEKYESFLDILISASEAISEKLGYKI